MRYNKKYRKYTRKEWETRQKIRIIKLYPCFILFFGVNITIRMIRFRCLFFNGE